MPHTHTPKREEILNRIDPDAQEFLMDEDIKTLHEHHALWESIIAETNDRGKPTGGIYILPGSKKGDTRADLILLIFTEMRPDAMRWHNIGDKKYLRVWWD